MNLNIILLTTIVFVTCTHKEPALRPAPHITPLWVLRSGKYAGKPIFIKINRALDSLADHAPLQYQAAASVVLKHPLESGLPGSEEEEALDRIEKILIHRLITTRLAVYGLKVESDNRCDFIFYTDNDKAIQKVFGHIKPLIDDYRIDFSVKRDRKWVSYHWFSSWE